MNTQLQSILFYGQMFSNEFAEAENAWRNTLPVGKGWNRQEQHEAMKQILERHDRRAEAMFDTDAWCLALISNLITRPENKIPAIKNVRFHTMLQLKEAKDLVDITTTMLFNVGLFKTPYNNQSTDQELTKLRPYLDEISKLIAKIKP